MANKHIDAYLRLAKIFKNKGFSLCLVGGTVRDFLLHIPLTDMDVATDATPIQVLSFLEGADGTFQQYGVVKYVFENIKFDITTLRVESNYDDSRHPKKVKFVTDLKKDYVRRDFTINAIYLDSYFNVIDYAHGKEDLANKIIRFVGKPKKRIKEDPLRIVRAIRFALKLGFGFEEETYKAMKKYSSLLENVNHVKIKEEIRKIGKVDEVLKEKLFNDFNIHQYIDVVK